MQQQLNTSVSNYLNTLSLNHSMGLLPVAMWRYLTKAWCSRDSVQAGAHCLTWTECFTLLVMLFLSASQCQRRTSVKLLESAQMVNILATLNYSVRKVTTELLSVTWGLILTHNIDMDQLRIGLPENTTHHHTSKSMTTLTDVVYSVHCPYWPLEAYEWVTRQRPHSLPSQSTIKEVVTYGCDFVQVSHKNRVNPNPTDWRFSFSKAEHIIIRSWTQSQRIVYRILHTLYFSVIKSRMHETAFCTYYFKTLMLWTCEEMPPEFWSEHVLINSICELLYQMIKWLNMKYCPNYFIPSNNMIDHLTDTDLSNDIDALYKMSLTKHTEPWIGGYRLLEEYIQNLMYCVELPMWIGTSLVIGDQICNVDDNFTNLYSMDLLTQLENVAKFDLSNIYESLKSQPLAIVI